MDILMDEELKQMDKAAAAGCLCIPIGLLVIFAAITAVSTALVLILLKVI